MEKVIRRGLRLVRLMWLFPATAHALEPQVHPHVSLRAAPPDWELPPPSTAFSLSSSKRVTCTHDAAYHPLLCSTLEPPPRPELRLPRFLDLRIFPGPARDQNPEHSDMDVAYDHITEESLPMEEEAVSAETQAAPESSLNADIQAAYTAFSSSPWGARIGGFFGSDVKQVWTCGHVLSRRIGCASRRLANVDPPRRKGRVCLPRSPAGSDLTRAGCHTRLLRVACIHRQPDTGPVPNIEPARCGCGRQREHRQRR